MGGGGKGVDDNDSNGACAGDALKSGGTNNITLWEIYLVGDRSNVKFSRGLCCYRWNYFHL